LRDIVLRAAALDAGRASAPVAARGGPSGLPPVPTELPATDFSFIFETGQREMDDKGLPESSKWAERISCGPRRQVEAIVDVKAGYVYDRTRQDPPNPPWGLLLAQARRTYTSIRNAGTGAW